MEPIKRHEFSFRSDSLSVGIFWDKNFKSIGFCLGPFAYVFNYFVVKDEV